jgi:hypothetical protein
VTAHLNLFLDQDSRHQIKLGNRLMISSKQQRRIRSELVMGHHERTANAVQAAATSGRRSEGDSRGEAALGSHG